MQPLNSIKTLRLATVLAGLTLAGFALSGCKGIPTKEERVARQDLKSVGDAFRPQNQRPALPTLQTNAGLSDFLHFAVLNQPQVEASYFDWAASVERITVERSLPDPRLTFESDIADIVMTVMPGLMQEFPGPGKLKAAAAVASAEGTVKYFRFETSVLQTAFALKQAYLEKIARAQNEVGKVTLQDVYRAQIEQDQLTTEVVNLEDSRHPLTASVIVGGLMPIMWSHGAGADVMKRIAIPMIGGVITSTVMELLVYPAIFYLWRSRHFRTSSPSEFNLVNREETKELV